MKTAHMVYIHISGQRRKTCCLTTHCIREAANLSSAWLHIYELTAHGKAFPKCSIWTRRRPKTSGNFVISESSLSETSEPSATLSATLASFSPLATSWEDEDAAERAELLAQVKTEPDKSKQEMDSDLWKSSGFSLLCGFVVALPLECFQKVLSFLGDASENTKSSKDFRAATKTSRKKRKDFMSEARELSQVDRSYHCCKHLLTQGSCLHGRVQTEPHGQSRRTVLHCWYCTQVFPSDSAGSVEDTWANDLCFYILGGWCSLASCAVLVQVLVDTSLGAIFWPCWAISLRRAMVVILARMGANFGDVSLS